MTQVVGRIIRRTQCVDMKFLKNVVDGQVLRKRGIGSLPDCRGGILIEQVGNTEIALQFEMGPMIERIAQGVRNGSRPGQEFFVRRGVAGDVSFRDAVGAHGTPFVMVAFEPYFEEIGESGDSRRCPGDEDDSDSRE